VIGAQMHHFSDTIGGAAVGLGTVLATALLLDLLISMRHRQHRDEGQAHGPEGRSGRLATDTEMGQGLRH